MKTMKIKLKNNCDSSNMENSAKNDTNNKDNTFKNTRWIFGICCQHGGWSRLIQQVNPSALRIEKTQFNFNWKKMEKNMKLNGVGRRRRFNKVNPFQAVFSMVITFATQESTMSFQELPFVALIFVPYYLSLLNFITELLVS